VATPLGWDEVEEGAEDPLGFEQFGPEQVLERVAEHGDLFTATT
jgi:bifunctional non-homologous end joining protein LigD